MAQEYFNNQTIHPYYLRHNLIVSNILVDGNPAGGDVIGPGLKVEWQNGPLGRPAEVQTGALVEDLLEAARQRLEFYQKANGGKFACRENSIAITEIENALYRLYARRMDRESRGVQGLNKA